MSHITQLFLGIICLSSCLASFTARADIGGSSMNTSANTSFFSQSRKHDADGVELYSTNLELKNHRKIGAGLSTGGVSGLLGFNLEINLEPENVAFVGLGRGQGYGTFNLGWKYNFDSEYLSPYTKVGYSRWYGVGSGDGARTDILNRILSKNEKETNKFSSDILFGALGLEYNQLEGELSGVNFFGEILVLSEIDEPTLLPTGTIGVTYFY